MKVEQTLSKGVDIVVGTMGKHLNSHLIHVLELIHREAAPFGEVRGTGPFLYTFLRPG